MASHKTDVAQATSENMEVRPFYAGDGGAGGGESAARITRFYMDVPNGDTTDYISGVITIKKDKQGVPFTHATASLRPAVNLPGNGRQLPPEDWKALKEELLPALKAVNEVARRLGVNLTVTTDTFKAAKHYVPPKKNGSNGNGTKPSDEDLAGF